MKRQGNLWDRMISFESLLLAARGQFGRTIRCQFIIIGDLARTKARYPFALFGYCLMSNPFHLLPKPAPG